VLRSCASGSNVPNPHSDLRHWRGRCSKHARFPGNRSFVADLYERVREALEDGAEDAHELAVPSEQAPTAGHGGTEARQAQGAKASCPPARHYMNGKIHSSRAELPRRPLDSTPDLPISDLSLIVESIRLTVRIAAATRTTVGVTIIANSMVTELSIAAFRIKRTLPHSSRFVATLDEIIIARRATVADPG
jgi:hypothetical protein